MTSATATTIRIHVPTPEQFAEDFMPAPDLTELYEQLIQDYPETHIYLMLFDRPLWITKSQMAFAYYAPIELRPIEDAADAP